SRSTFNDVAHIGQRFDVVDHRRHAERPDISGKWRLDARVSALAFQRLDQTCLFTTDIGPCTTVQEDIEVHVCPQNVLPQISSRVRLINRGLQPLCPQKKLAAQIDKSEMGSHGVTTDDQPFEYLMRVFFDEHAIFEGAWFRLVTVANEIAWAIIFRQKPPFDP